MLGLELSSLQLYLGLNELVRPLSEEFPISCEKPESPENRESDFCLKRWISKFWAPSSASVLLKLIAMEGLGMRLSGYKIVFIGCCFYILFFTV